MSEGFDILIQNTTIIDGSGKPRFTGDVGIKGGKIAAVGKVQGEAARVIDGSGLVTSPGFVDPHSHVDLNILQEPLAENLLMQGVTTFIGCNCGHCRAPLRGQQYAARWNEYLGLAPDDCVDADWRTFGEFLARVES
ncbi:MAG: hypothetical protein JXA42_00710, partial [Anaerolineales bacterium]|nr:hypothetical protein [Anaerolineales bacterium]